MNWLFGFDGRINRAKYLGAFAIYLIPGGIASMMADRGSGFGIVLLLGVAFLMSMTAAKRLHDLGHSGWWQLVGLIPLVNLGLGIYMLFWKGTTGDNRFGPDPLGEQVALSPESPVRPTQAENFSPAVIKKSVPEPVIQQSSVVMPEKVVMQPMSVAEIDEDAIYGIIADEIDNGKIEKGLWTRLLVELDGDETRTKIAYIKHRAEKLIAAEKDRLAELERQRAEDAEKAEALRKERLAKRVFSSLEDSPELRQEIADLYQSASGPSFMRKVRLNKIDEVNSSIDDNPLYLGMVDSSGKTALHLAVEERYVNMTRLLVERGAQANKADLHGQTPVDIANKIGKPELIAALTPI